MTEVMNLLVSLAEGASVFGLSHGVASCCTLSHQSRVLIDNPAHTSYLAIASRLMQVQSVCMV